MPSYQQQIYFFSSLKSAVLCLYQGRTRREREKKKDWLGKPGNPVESALAVGKKWQKLFKVCNSRFPEAPKQHMSTKVGMTYEAGRDRMKKSPVGCEIKSQTCSLNPELPRLKSRVSIPKGKLERGSRGRHVEVGRAVMFARGITLLTTRRWFL